MDKYKGRLAIKPPEVAELTGASLPTVYGWIHRAFDPLPSFREGRAIYCPVSSVEDWLERQAEQGASA